VLELRRGLSRLGLFLLGLLKRSAELADSLSKRPRQTGQALGAQHDQRDQGDEQQMDGTLDTHARLQVRTPTRPLRLAATAGADRRLLRMASGSPAARAREYPPPPATELFWPAQATVLGAIVLQLTLPERLTVGPAWLLPTLEGALLLGLIASTPRRLEREHPRRRAVALALIAFVSAANIFSLGALTHFLLHHHTRHPRELLVAGVLIWLTNFLIFALWYWELDRGGPGKRAAGHDEPPDFLFPQMTDDRIEPLNWRPQFIDYLYVSLTNATAFSPTDAMPLTPMAKGVMGVQSLASLVTAGLIVARAVNILT